MGHTVSFNKVIVAPKGHVFDMYTKHMKLYKMGALDKAREVRTKYSDKKASKRFTDAFMKTIDDRGYPDSFSMKCYDVGIDHYEVHRTVTKIVDHKKREVVESHSYKSKPSRILKGGTLYEYHLFVCDIDYDDDSIELYMNNF